MWKASCVTRVQFLPASPGSMSKERQPALRCASARISPASTPARRMALGWESAGVSTQSLRRVVEFLRTRKGLTHPLAECRLIVTGADVQIAHSPQKIMSVLRTPGQTSFAFVFDLARTVGEMKEEMESRERKPPARASASLPARRLAPQRAG